MSRTVKAQITLRELILNGQLQPGERLLELALVEQIGVSRTPIRAALARLADEGLLEKMSNGGYAVREFSERDIHDAVTVRGEMEGMAVRLAAERGVAPAALNAIKQCLDQIDVLLEKKELDDEDLETYLTLNQSFHKQLVGLAESFVIERMLEHVMTLPFATPSSLVMAQSDIGNAWKVFFVAQEQHKSIVDAIENREGTRAAALAQEHARLSLQTLRLALRNKTSLYHVPGFNLVFSDLVEPEN